MPSLGALIRKKRLKFETQIPELDENVSLEHGQQLEILGTPGTGKTALCLAYTIDALIEGAKVCWISPRAFPLERLAAHPKFSAQIVKRLTFLNPTDQELFFMEPPRADLVILEHYENYASQSDDTFVLGEMLSKWVDSVLLVTGTLCKIQGALVPFGGGFKKHGFKSLVLTHSNQFEVMAQIGFKTMWLKFVQSSQDLEVPELISSISEPETESPWGLDATSTPKRERIFYPGSPREIKRQRREMCQIEPIAPPDAQPL